MKKNLQKKIGYSMVLSRKAVPMAMEHSNKDLFLVFSGGA